MYFEDLTKYDHAGERTNGNNTMPDIFSYADVKNIGWLDSHHKFSTGNPPNGFIDKLKKYCIYNREHISPANIIQTRGFHECEFCKDGEKRGTSSSEILIISKDKKYYICPKMVLHYVKDHNYLPPQEFINAVMNGPEPESEKYKIEKDALLKEVGDKWRIDYKKLREKEKLNENLITKFKNFDS